MPGKFGAYNIGEEKHPTRYYSKKQEDSVAKATGGKTTANSGATVYQKGDVSLKASTHNSFLIECKTKTTPSKSITIQKEWFDKNRDEMILEGKDHQALVFSFGPGGENHYIIDEYLFQELVEYLKNKVED